MAANNYATHKWWKEATVYQIYPASFLSTGSGSEPGWGDIKGIAKKLDYLKDLGVDVVWTSPIYKSPQVDMGYDIEDYEDIDPRYGTLADIDDLIAGLKSRGMRLMMDLVVNHTSDQHAWFLNSKSSKTAEQRDWYIWQPPRYDSSGARQPPNNWSQILGIANSAWTWHEPTQEYYLSLFTPEQPDLNWRNPAVREAVHDILRFWLTRGVSGFRMDVINLISKVENYPDAAITLPGAKFQPGHDLYANGPHLHEYLREMRQKALGDFDTITVGEMPFIQNEDEILRVVSAEADELNMIFIFDIVDIDNADTRLSLAPWTPSDLRKIVTKWQTVMHAHNGWNSVFIENHDNPRSVSRYVDDSDEFREISAKMLCLMVATLGGTLYLFQGQELGMRNLPASFGVEEYKDIETINYIQSITTEHPGDEKAFEEGKKVIQCKARDHSRTPVQWSGDTNAGFCAPDTKPWMRVNPDYTSCNAKTQLSHPDGSSVLQFWRSALQRRKHYKDVFVYGKFECLDEKHESVFAYQRTSESGEGWVVVLNFSGKETVWTVPGGLEVGWVESSYGNGLVGLEVEREGKVRLGAWEGVLGRALLNVGDGPVTQI